MKEGQYSNYQGLTGISDDIICGTCNLCGSSDAKIIFPQDSYPDGKSGNIVKCKQCGLVYRDNYKDITAKASKDTGYRHDSPDPLTENRKKIFADYLKYLQPFRKNNRILDFGFGEGYFLSLCSKDGWEVYGVDTNPEFVDHVKLHYGIGKVAGSIEDAHYPEDYFDVITCWNVLEHVKDPYRTLKEIYRILRPNGVIFLRFPNASFHIPCRLLFVALYKGWSRVKGFNQSVIHRYSYDKTTIYQYLRNSGFDSIEVNNSVSKWSRETQLLSVRKIVGLVTECFATIVRTMSFGNMLLAPGLFVKAVKSY